MSNDLEKFLQQAAERLAQKSAGKGNAPKRAKPSQGQSGQTRSSSAPSSSGRSQQRRPPRLPPEQPIILDDNYEQPTETRRLTNLREAGPDPLSTIDTRPSLTDAFNQADHRVSDHVQQVFDHKISNLRAASDSLGDASAAAAKRIDTSSKKTLFEMLCNPDSLRTAFIASEIFKRPT